MVILQLSRWKFSHKETLYSRLYSTEIEFYFKKPQKSLFDAPFGDFGGNVYALQGTPSIARLKARGRVFVTIQLLLLSLMVETL